MATPFFKPLGPGPVPMTLALQGSANAAASILPLLAQIQLLLTGAFGLGPLKADLLAQFNAAVGFSIAFGNPLIALKGAVAATAQILAALRAALAIGIAPPTFSVSASLKLAATLQLKLGGINLLIDLSLGIRLAGINFLAQLNLALSLGGLQLYAWEGQDMVTTKAQIAAYNFGPDGFPPLTQVYGVMLVTATPGASGSFKFLFNPALP